MRKVVGDLDAHVPITQAAITQFENSGSAEDFVEAASWLDPLVHGLGCEYSAGTEPAGRFYMITRGLAMSMLSGARMEDKQMEMFGKAAELIDRIPDTEEEGYNDGMWMLRGIARTRIQEYLSVVPEKTTYGLTIASTEPMDLSKFGDGRPRLSVSLSSRGGSLDARMLYSQGTNVDMSLEPIDIVSVPPRKHNRHHGFRPQDAPEQVEANFNRLLVEAAVDLSLLDY